MQKLDSEGLQLFKPVTPAKKENADDDQANDIDPKAELEAQFAAAALAERRAAEAARKEEEMHQALETLMSENMNRIKTALDARNEQLLQQIFATEEKIMGKPTRRT
ncbi:hypothetical protein TRFO_01598 [Tritrichomonas foetus]|uniref:Uncharacterized protein n=1 Tax=Tritrichomonas foetus TaxID=1144522 RepID=A0A1J4K301_9EUKA|nr:hypothetical protein TRFO_01598 [Tritrichomonas foetus]|eukprot:OHT03869.1 hypothetical protein TRFO_01598 [Tritrichomonas foetus]